MNNTLLGFRIVVTDAARGSSWIFPQEPFFEWEPHDEWFCRRYGIGHQGPEKPCIIRVGGSLLVHPDLYEQFKKQCEG